MWELAPALPLCLPAKRPCGSWGGTAAAAVPCPQAPPPCTAVGAAFSATQFRPGSPTRDLGAYEAAAAGLVISDKGFQRLRWALGRMWDGGGAGGCGGEGGERFPGRGLAQGFASAETSCSVEQVVELLRDGWGGVLMTALQARQLREVLSHDVGSSTPVAVDPDLDYVLCCRVVDWWNLSLSYPAYESGAAAAIDAYSLGRALPTLPMMQAGVSPDLAKGMVAEMVEHSAAVERRLSGVTKPLCSPRWAGAHAAEASIAAAESANRLRVRQLCMVEAAAAYDAAVERLRLRQQ